MLAAKDKPGQSPEDLALEAQIDVVGALVDRLLTLRAGSIEALQVKARGIRWCHGGPPSIIDPDRKATTDVLLAQSILDDLLALPR